MGIERVKEWLEELYTQYEKSYGEVMLNYFTNRLWDKIYSESHCKRIIDKITSSFPYSDKTLKCGKEFFTDLDHITDSKWQEYISYSIHRLLWERKKRPKFMHCEPYCNNINWTYLGNVDEHTKVMSFKTDFIRPIIDYIEDSLKTSSSIIEEINRYKMRVERFQTIDIEKELDEEELQKDLSLYLFDKGFEYTREPNINKGRPDFVIYDDNTSSAKLDKGIEPLIIEVKFFRTSRSITKRAISKAIKQVKDYASQLGNLEWCLLIYVKTTDILEKGAEIIGQSDLGTSNIIFINLDKELPSKIR